MIRPDVIRICSDLVKIRSENPPGYTDEVISYIQDFCDSIGYKTRVESRGRRHNLLSAKPSGRLLLCGHVDVVPALDEGWIYPPYSGIITEDYVHGRGSTDMKGGCAALLSALANTLETDGDPGVDIAFVADEEGKGEFGMEQLVSEGLLKPCDCLIAEPSPPTCPVVGEKGVLRTRVTFTGDAGHASLHPVAGNSAIMQACRFLDECHSLHQVVWPTDRCTQSAIHATARALEDLIGISSADADIILSHIMYNPGMIHGGERFNIIAQRCTLDLDMRVPWGCSIEKVVWMMREKAPEAMISVFESANPSFSTPGWLTSLICQGIELVMNTPAHPGVSQAASDARYLREHGAEVVVYGPGDLNLLHSVNENVPISMLQNCRDVYCHVLKNLGNIT
jgi:succinyl-diaminopimelate desuccinylase